MTMPLSTMPLYAAGEWSTCPDPVPDGDDIDQTRNSAGYTHATRFGPQRDEGTLHIGVYASQRFAWSVDNQPEYLIDVEFQEGVETVAVATLPDLMDLLSTWAPAIQAGLASDQARGLFDD